tara:strand:- start:97 stop:339 length:243 start_codon:yes stop_codon:yes gene_type:complete
MAFNNPAKNVLAAFNAIPEIKDKVTISNGKGMMGSRSILRKDMESKNNEFTNSPAYSVAKMQQKLKKIRMEIKNSKEEKV